jgi:hypothetical protein
MRNGRGSGGGGGGLVTAAARDEQRKMIKYNHLVANLPIFHTAIGMTRALDGIAADGFGDAASPEGIATLTRLEQHESLPDRAHQPVRRLRARICRCRPRRCRPRRRTDRRSVRQLKPSASTRALRSAVAERPVVQRGEQRGKRDDRGHQPDKDQVNRGSPSPESGGRSCRTPLPISLLFACGRAMHGIAALGDEAHTADVAYPSLAPN